MTNITSESKKVETVNSEELAFLKEMAALGSAVTSLTAVVENITRLRQNINMILARNLYHDLDRVLEVEDMDDILMLCEFLDNINK